MSLRNLETPMFVEEPPEFEYRNGLFHIRQRFSENCVVERVMRPYVFMLSLRRAAEVAREHRLGGAAILPFERPDEEDIAAEH